MNTPVEIRQFGDMPGTPSLLLRSALTFNRRGSWPDRLPSAHFAALPFDAEYLQRYHSLFGCDEKTPLLTALYPLAQRAQLALLLEREFPFPIPGVVHLGNELTALAPIDWQSGFDLVVAVTRLPEARNGAQCLDLSVQIAQQGRHVARCDSHYLVQRGRGAMRRTNSASALNLIMHQEPWAITQAEIRHYARVSGDYNPIHLHPFAASLLGAPGAMAHGMYLAARACANLQHWHGKPVSALSVDFLKPVLLPATTLSFQADSQQFRLTVNERPVAQGRYRLADATPVSASS